MMKTFDLGHSNHLVYDYQPPADGGVTFTFFNALSGGADMWTGESIGGALRASGHGLCVFNMRGQADTGYASMLSQDHNPVVEDALALMREVAPVRPVYVGLSIGGLFAALVHLGGAPAVGLALINTLRKDGPRLSWINAAVTQAARVGGPALLMDLYAPMLFAEPWLAANRASALDAQAYVPADETTGAFMLLASGGSASWDVPWDRIQVPTLVLTGLRDRVFYVEDDVDNISSRMAAATRVNFDDAGHLIPIEQPAALARELLSLATRCD